jgi:hypothetical protein
MSTRVVQWATGVSGQWSLQQIIDRPDLELAGVLVYDHGKAGKDAGDLCERGTTGVTATTDKEAIFALDADVVIHTARGHKTDEADPPFDDDVIRLLESGKDVISAAAYWARDTEDPALLERIDAACARGGSTLFGVGVDPGFVFDRLPATLSGLCADVRGLRMTEICDISTYPGDEVLFGLLGFGKRPEELDLQSPATDYLTSRLFPASVAKLARLLGVTLDRVERPDLSGIEFAFASKDLDLPAGTIAEGTISGFNYVYTGYRDGEPFITQQWTHYVERAGVPDHWPTVPVTTETDQTYRIRIHIDGVPAITTEIDIEHRDPVWLGVAAVAIRAIDGVRAAPPGLLEEPVFGAWTPGQTVAVTEAAV